MTTSRPTRRQRRDDGGSESLASNSASSPCKEREPASSSAAKCQLGGTMTATTMKCTTNNNKVLLERKARAALARTKCLGPENDDSIANAVIQPTQKESHLQRNIKGFPSLGGVSLPSEPDARQDEFGPCDTDPFESVSESDISDQDMLALFNQFERQNTQTQSEDMVDSLSSAQSHLPLPAGSEHEEWDEGISDVDMESIDAPQTTLSLPMTAFLVDSGSLSKEQDFDEDEFESEKFEWNTWTQSLV